MDNFELVDGIKNSKDITLLLFSCSQQALHMETFAEHLANNLKIMGRQQSTDYMIIAIFTNRALCERYYNLIVRQLKPVQLSKFTVEELLKSL